MVFSDLRTINNYIIFSIVSPLMSYLPERFQAPSRKLTTFLSGVRETPAQWSRCIDRTTSAFGYAVGAMFVDEYFPETDKEQVNNILNDIVREFTSNLDDVTWMDDVTKAAAHRKLDFLGRKLAYPEFIKDAILLDKFYANVSVQ